MKKRKQASPKRGRGRRGNGSAKNIIVKPGQRVCLRCQRAFESEGPANRICGSCAALNGRLIDRTAQTSVSQDGRVMRKHVGGP